MFANAIVKTPGHSLVHGLTEATSGRPDYAKALEQHHHYVAALQSCGLDVLVLDAEEAFPDSTFVEDTAVLIPECAVITRPAAPSRCDEVQTMRPVLERFFSRIEEIKDPGTLEGGDVMQVGRHFFIGLSKRTNRSGAEQLIRILQSYGYTGSTVAVTQFLHLKTGVTCIAHNTLLASGEFIGQVEFLDYRVLQVPETEAGGANGIEINGRVLLPSGYPVVRQMLAERNIDMIEVDISEFAKLDGGLTCLSLRF